MVGQQKWKRGNSIKQTSVNATLNNRTSAQLSKGTFLPKLVFIALPPMKGTMICVALNENPAMELVG
jgi:hypothetical protein